MIVVWRVTERCNLQCPFCAYDRTLPRKRADAAPDDILQFGRILADYQKSTGDSVLVSWLGGEPLRWAPLEAITETFSGTFGLRISATTNGTTLKDARTRAHLLACYEELTISVDAIGARHDALRGWPGGYAELRESVRKLIAEREGRALRLRINAVLMRQSIAQFPTLCGELASWGVDEITFNQLGGRDRPEYFPSHRLLPEQIDRLREILPGLRAALSENGVRLAGSEAYLDRFAASARDERLAFPDCKPGEHFLFIDERGMASPCSFTADTCGIPIAELKTSQDLRRLPMVFRELRESARPMPCQDCHSTQVFAKFAA